MSQAKKWLLIGTGVVFAADLGLLLSGYRILISEERGVDYAPYSKYLPPREIGATLKCTYWTGRGVRTATAGAYDWKPDECPFLLKPAYLK